MATSTRSRTTVKTGDNPAVVRTPVTRNDHPLGDSPSTQDSFAHVSQPGSKTQVDTSLSEEEDENEEGKEEGLSDQDEALSTGEGSSYGEGSELGLPTLANLVELNEPRCRVPTRVASSDGSKVAGVCGRTVEE